MRRRRVKPGHPVTAAAGFVSALILSRGSATTWVLLMAGAVAVALLLTWFRSGARKPAQRPARKPPAEFAERKRAAGRQPSTAGTGRGWRPPATPDLLPMMISEECSDGACALCPGHGCEHDCRHDTATIVARNEAEYDKARAKS